MFALGGAVGSSVIDVAFESIIIVSFILLIDEGHNSLFCICICILNSDGLTADTG
jgi:hypothetical protein